MSDPTRDPTRFDLDERQRAMLAEMGIRVWWPTAPVPEAAPAGPAADAAAAADAVVPQAASPAQLNPAPQQAARPAPTVDAPATPVATVSSAPKHLPSSPAGAGAAGPAGGRPSAVRSPAAIPGGAVAKQQPAPMHTVALPEGIAQMDWDALQAAVRDCRACGLCSRRTNTVFGAGDRQARWLVVGEAPGEHEDRQGEPFVGPSGQLLDNMLRAIGLSRNVQGKQDGLAGVYIANTLKCRPPGNRNPEPVELQTCNPYLQRQIELLQPRIILAMGRMAVQALLGSTEPLGKLRGRVHHHHGVPVVVTYHPAYLLRSLPDKAKAWEDLCLALQTAQQQP